MMISFDTETFLIREGHIAPEIVCMTAYEEGEVILAAKADPENALESLCEMVVAEESTCFAHNTAFDLAVVCTNYPYLFPVVFEGLTEGKYECTGIREKLLWLADTGDLAYMETPSGAKLPHKWSLATLVMRYFNQDISESKDDPDSWRLNYKELVDMSSAEWPQDAVDYAKEDSVWTAKVYEAQEERRQEIKEQTGHDPFVTSAFRTAMAFALQLTSCPGLHVDAEAKAKIEEMLKRELHPDKMVHLIAAKILVPEQPPRPYANGAVDAEGKPKMVAAVREKVTKKLFSAHCIALAKKHGWHVPYTDATDRYPDGQPSFTMPWVESHEGFDVTLDEYLHRQKLQKLVTTEMPRLNRPDGTTAKLVHPMFDSLKETGRSSSYGVDGWPSLNGQNVDPRARPCIVAPEGFVLVSIDYNQMELGTAAQICLNLFGESVLADKINAGVDVHAYLGAQIAAATDENFQAILDDSQVVVSEQDKVFDLFFRCKTYKKENTRKFFKRYRTLAKPVGLGFPGGLGPATFITFAKATYGVDLDLETATELREIWRETFPEMPRYHAWINNQAVDEINSEGKDKKYSYTSPLGMYRAGCGYCAAANGNALQTPSAEGALSGLLMCCRACYDVTEPHADLMVGHTFPVNFIHDEILFYIRDDEFLMERINVLKDTMVDMMQMITPDVKASVEACTMHRWYKQAEPVFNDLGTLIPWEPTDG